MAFQALPDWQTHALRRVTHPGSAGADASAPRTFPHLALGISSSSASLIVSCSQLGHLHVSLGSVIHSSKLLKAKEGAAGTSVLYLCQTEVVGAQGACYLRLASEAGGGEGRAGGWSPSLEGSDTVPREVAWDTQLPPSMAWRKENLTLLVTSS